MDIKNPILRRIYALDGDIDEIKRAYGQWASAYDEDTQKGMGYVAPLLGAAALAERVSEDAEVLDAGCGTGLVGAALHEHGLEKIDGTDISPEMLDRAKAKGAYRQLSEADLTGQLKIATDTYDGVICVGVFTSGHVGPDALDELARVARPGAPIVATVHQNVWEKDGYPAQIDKMQRRGDIAVEQIMDAPYHENEGLRCQLCLLRAA